MEMSVIKSLWNAKNPGGNIWITDSAGHLFDNGKQTGKFAVTYKADSKIYTYAYKSVYKLAERLNLIPDNNLDYWVEAEKAISAMDNGESFISICGLHDTISHIITEKTGKYCHLIAEDYDKDIYDRSQWIFKGYKFYNNFNEAWQDNHK
jgi:hypothetical protein